MEKITKYYDYDCDEFYLELYQLAFNGAYDSQIASALEDKLGITIGKVAFSQMLAGKYGNWTAEENERRSKRMKATLEKARDNTNRLVLGRILKVGLGGVTVKSKTVVKRRMEIGGELTDNQLIQTTEVENETPPNLQALSMWMYHHSPEWRKIQRGEEMDSDDTEPAKRGIDISEWISKEMDEKELEDEA